VLSDVDQFLHLLLPIPSLSIFPTLVHPTIINPSPTRPISLIIDRHEITTIIHPKHTMSAFDPTTVHSIVDVRKHGAGHQYAVRTREDDDIYVADAVIRGSDGLARMRLEYHLANPTKPVPRDVAESDEFRAALRAAEEIDGVEGRDFPGEQRERPETTQEDVRRETEASLAREMEQSLGQEMEERLARKSR
jgi:hypothetical protein